MSLRKIQRIGITTRHKIENPKVLDKLVECLIESKKEVYLSRKAVTNLSKKNPKVGLTKDLPLEEKLDLLIVLGGDGSILNAVQKMPHLSTYVLGINAGTLGFLSEIPPDNLENTCLTIWDDHYSRDERMLLQGSIERNGKSILEFRALNEVVISQSAISRLVEIPTTIDDIPITVFRADGLIVATPTGSTAYNLSAGGPIIHPRVEAMILTPIAPFSFSQKPLVIPAEKTVEMDIIDSNKEAMMISIDGQVHETLKPGDKITLSRHPESVTFLRLPQESYFSTLREKLKWGEGL